MALSVQILHGRVVGVFVRDKVGALDGATVRILVLAVEDVLVQVNVVDIDGAVESDRDHLGHLGGFDVARNPGSVSRAEAIGQNALSGIAFGGTVRVQFDGWIEEKGDVVVRVFDRDPNIGL